MTRLDTTLPLFDPAANPGRARDTASQRDAWLRQMEQVQLSAMRSANLPDPAQSRETRLEADLSAAPTQPREAADAGGSVMHRHVVLRAPAGRVTATAPYDNEHFPAVAAAAPSCMPVALALLTPAAAQARPASDSGIRTVTATAAVAPSPAAMPPAAPPALHWASEQREAPPPSAAERAHGYCRDWPERLLHITSDGTALAVWIRDSALDKSTAALLVEQIAQEGASRGLQLRSATLNGRTLFLGPEAPTAKAGSLVGPASLEPIERKEDHGTR